MARAGARTSRAHLRRRSFLESGAAAVGTAALFNAAKMAFPGGAFAASAGPETTKAILGYIALTDASPLVIAKEKGLFAKHGVPDVEVAKQASWGATRDNLTLGSDEERHRRGTILSPMPYLMTAGKITQNNVPVPMPSRRSVELRLPGHLPLQRIQGSQGRTSTRRR